MMMRRKDLENGKRRISSSQVKLVCSENGRRKFNEGGINLREFPNPLKVQKMIMNWKRNTLRKEKNI